MSTYYLPFRGEIVDLAARGRRLFMDENKASLPSKLGE